MNKISYRQQIKHLIKPKPQIWISAKDKYIDSYSTEGIEYRLQMFEKLNEMYDLWSLLTREERNKFTTGYTVPMLREVINNRGK